MFSPAPGVNKTTTGQEGALLIENVEHTVRQRCTVTLKAEPVAVPTTRDILRAALRGWGVDDHADDACLVATELVNNAVQHSLGVTMTASPAPDGKVTLEVRDDSPAPPVTQDASPDSEAGRGLLIIDALASVWGWHPINGGKIVWAIV